mmetsp:Transcript_3837/g.6908  ORF Transcript_3837/g.6908 Transcript_3837/m.6908 type:complete len:302 (+) Transcript_3837:149-1054(+)
MHTGSTAASRLQTSDHLGILRVSLTVAHIRVSRIVHHVYLLGECLLNNCSFQFFRWSQETLLLRKVIREYHELLDLEGVVGADLPIGICGLHGRGDGLDPNIVPYGCADCGHLWVHSTCTSIQLVCSRCFTIGSNSLQRNQGNIVLALVPNHHHFINSITGGFDVVLDGHRGDVLSPSPDDQLLVASSDFDHPRLRDHAFVPRVEPALVVDGLGSLLLNLLHVIRAKALLRQVPHHDATTPEAKLTLVDVVLMVHARGPRTFLLPIALRFESLHLHARELESARTPQMRTIRRYRASCTRL